MLRVAPWLFECLATSAWEWPDSAKKKRAHIDLQGIFYTEKINNFEKKIFISLCALKIRAIISFFKNKSEPILMLHLIVLFTEKLISHQRQGSNQSCGMSVQINE